jgi:putative ABC transport system substrate-binding protein
MRRREFIGLFGSVAAAWPLAAGAQQVRRIGVLMNTAATDPFGTSNVAAFVQALGQLGWVEGRNHRSISDGTPAMQRWRKSTRHS